MAASAASVEDRIRECNDDLPALKKLARVWKTKFTTSCVGIEAALNRLRRDLTDPVQGDSVMEKVREVQDNFDNVQRIYEKIGTHVDVSEELFQTDYAPKMLDITQKMDGIKESRSMVMSEVEKEHKKLADKERSKKKRNEEEVEEREKGEKKSWKLENGLKPSSKLSLDMSQVEIQGWKRGWNTYYSVSQLQYAPLETVRYLLMGVLDDTLAARVEEEVEKQVTVIKMLEKIEEEILLMNPMIVTRFEWI